MNKLNSIADIVTIISFVILIATKFASVLPPPYPIRTYI